VVVRARVREGGREGGREERVVQTRVSWKPPEILMWRVSISTAAIAPFLPPFLLLSLSIIPAPVALLLLLLVLPALQLPPSLPPSFKSTSYIPATASSISHGGAKCGVPSVSNVHTLPPSLPSSPSSCSSSLNNTNAAFATIPP